MTKIEFPRIYSRTRWGARKPGPMEDQAMPVEAFIHHSADTRAHAINTLEEQIAKMKQIQSFHMDANGWSDIGYHYVVFQWVGSEKQARVFAGRQASKVPAAQANHNSRTLAICVIGHGARDEMYRNTRYAIEQIIRSYPSIIAVGGHRDVVATECPGDNFQASIPRICDAINRSPYKKR